MRVTRSRQFAAFVQATVVAFGLSAGLYADPPTRTALQWSHTAGSQSVRMLVFSRDSRWLWTADSSNGTIQTWTARTGHKVGEISLGRQVGWTHLAPLQDELIILSDVNGGIWHCSLPANKAEHIVDDKNEVRAIACDDATRQVHVVRANGVLERLNLKDGGVSRSVRQLPVEVRCARFSKSGQQLAVAGWNSEVHVLPVDGKRSPWRAKYDSTVADLAFAENDDLLVIAQRSGTCRCVNLRTSQSRWVVSVRPDVFACDVSPKSDYLYVGVGAISKAASRVPRASFYAIRASDGQVIRSQRLKGDVVTALQVSPDAKTVAVTAGGQLWVWDTE